MLDVLKSYAGTSIVYSGHTHFMQQVEQACPTVMVSQAAKNVWTVHVPSLNYPRDKNRSTVAESMPDIQPSQGFFVECYKGMTVLKCIEFNGACAPASSWVLKSYAIST